MSDLVTKHKRVFRTDSEFRSLPQFHRAVELVRNGRIGKLHTIRTSVPMGESKSPPFVEMPVPEELNYDLWQGPAAVKPYTEQRVHQIKGYERPGWMNIRDYSDSMILNWTTHLNDIAQWGNNTDRTGPVAVEGHGKYPPPGSLWDACYEFEFTCTYADGVKLICKTDTCAPHTRFEGEGGLGSGQFRRRAARGRAQVALGLEDRSQRTAFPVDARETRLPQCGEDPRRRPWKTPKSDIARPRWDTWARSPSSWAAS